MTCNRVRINIDEPPYWAVACSNQEHSYAGFGSANATECRAVTGYKREQEAPTFETPQEVLAAAYRRTISKKADVDADALAKYSVATLSMAEYIIVSRRRYKHLKDAEASLTKVRELHRHTYVEYPPHKYDNGYCDECTNNWPCPTIQAIGES